MERHTAGRTALKWTAGALGFATAAYATYAGLTWLRYGRASPPTADAADPLLDEFMPVYEIAERHHIRVAAPADITFYAACDQDMMASLVVRAIFKARELVLRSDADTTPRPRGLLALAKSIGWACLRKSRSARSSWAP